MERDIKDCSECGMMFDGRDRRAFIPTNTKLYPDLEPICPACNQMQNGAEAWSLWNSCQGLFPDFVVLTRAEAEQKMSELGDSIDKVVPVRVIIEPEDQWFDRNFSEDCEERERERFAE